MAIVIAYALFAVVGMASETVTGEGAATGSPRNRPAALIVKPVGGPVATTHTVLCHP